jgi:hypothetical protein
LGLPLQELSKRSAPAAVVDQWSDDHKLSDLEAASRVQALPIDDAFQLVQFKQQC